jgi:ABC-type tungstate transport system substrate-binding protein
MPGALDAWHLIVGGDAALISIVRLSLLVSLSAVAIAALVGMPFGAMLALTLFPGRAVVVVILNAFMHERTAGFGAKRSFGKTPTSANGLCFRLTTDDLFG